MEVNGKKCAVHRDHAGELNVVSAVCPHMGCIVHWNEAETSWDCPCHGSRFSIDGEVLEGPAIAALKKVDITNEQTIISNKQNPGKLKAYASYNAGPFYLINVTYQFFYGCRNCFSICLAGQLFCCNTHYLTHVGG